MLYNEIQIQKLKKIQRRKGGQETRIDIRVILDPEELIKLRNLSPSKSILRERENPIKFKLKTNKVKDLHSAYTAPIRIIKMTIDNTHDYVIPPALLEKFLYEILQTKEG